MKRGTLVLAVIPGDYGKVRPMLIVQAHDMDVFDSIIGCPLSSAIETAGPLRPKILKHERNQLDQDSVVMIEKVGAFEKSRIRRQLGAVTDEQLAGVDETLAVLLGLAP